MRCISAIGPKMAFIDKDLAVSFFGLVSFYVIVQVLLGDEQLSLRVSICESTRQLLIHLIQYALR